MRKITAYNDFNVKVGAKIRELRLRSNLTQLELAAAMDMSFQQIQKYEGGKNRLSAETLHILSRILNFSIDDIMNQIAEMSEVIKKGPGPTNQEISALMKAFNELKSPRRRNSVIQLVKAMVDN